MGPFRRTLFRIEAMILSEALLWDAFFFGTVVCVRVPGAYSMFTFACFAGDFQSWSIKSCLELMARVTHVTSIGWSNVRPMSGFRARNVRNCRGLRGMLYAQYSSHAYFGILPPRRSRIWCYLSGRRACQAVHMLHGNSSTAICTEQACKKELLTLGRSSSTAFAVFPTEHARDEAISRELVIVHSFFLQVRLRTEGPLQTDLA